jgi:multiple sugar transport system ATP-binding protein
MGSVRLRAVRKAFGAFAAIHSIDLDIDEGEFVTLIGPSGCGKSTLLRMIAGLEEITDGSIEIDGREVNDLPAKDRNVAMVFQSYALYPHMTVRENMSFSLRLSKTDRAEIDRRVLNAASILNLSSLMERYPRQLSGGQRQRVAMGRAIVRDPSVFLFDEPLSNLDAQLRVSMRAEIKSLHNRLTTTTIYVTHDQIEAMTMADKIVVLRDGKVEQMGQPITLYDRPNNLFVAAFIGSPSMNFLNGTLMSNAGKPVVQLKDGTHLPLVDAGRASIGDSVVYGIRPEHLRLTDPDIEATISVVEPTGSETHVLATLGEQVLTGVFRDRLSHRSGDVIPIGIDQTKAHLFNPSTGLRLN